MTVKQIILIHVFSNINIVLFKTILRHFVIIKQTLLT